MRTEGPRPGPTGTQARPVSLSSPWRGSARGRGGPVGLPHAPTCCRARGLWGLDLGGEWSLEPQN